MNAVVKFLSVLQKFFVKVALALNPSGAKKVGTETPKFEWTEWRSQVKAWHFAVAIATIGLVIAVAWTLMGNPVGKYSVISGLSSFANWIISSVFPGMPDLSKYIHFGLFILLLKNRRKVLTIYSLWDAQSKSFPELALREEVIFRTGAENFSFSQKILSCVSFGAAHFSMMLVPLGALPALSLAGAVFMATYLYHYRQTHVATAATVQAATVHTTYNLVLICAVFAILAISIVQSVVAVF